MAHRLNYHILRLSVHVYVACTYGPPVAADVQEYSSNHSLISNGRWLWDNYIYTRRISRLT